MPEAAPLGDYASVTLISPAESPTPADYTVPGDPGPDLATVAPAPPASRDPKQPFEAGQEDQLAGAAERDPREPFITGTTGGGPAFAPPTGQPVAGAGNWAPPTGRPVSGPGAWAAPGGAPAVAPGSARMAASATWGSRALPPEHTVGAIARSASDPYAQRFAAAHRAPAAPSGVPASPGYPAQGGGAPVRGGGVPVQGGYPAPVQGGYPAPVHGGYTAPSAAPAGWTRGPDAQIRAEYWSASAAGKFGVVLKALPWPVLLVLLVGIVLQNGAWSFWALVLSFIICNGNTKVAKVVLNRVFAIASALWFVTWVVAWLTQSMSISVTIYNVYYVMGQWLCAILIVVAPVIVWRGLERR